MSDIHASSVSHQLAKFYVEQKTFDPAHLWYPRSRSWLLFNLDF
jgi:hypothetical protein